MGTFFFFSFSKKLSNLNQVLIKQTSSK